MISPSTINVSNVVNAMEGDGAYAEEGSVGSVESSGVDVEDDPSTYTNAHEEKEGSGDGESRDEDSSSPSSPSLSSSTSATYDVEDHDIGNSTDTPTSRAASPSAALTINNGGSVNTSASTTVGETAYISNTVNVQASEIKSYVLQVSYASGSTGLKSSDGKVTIGGAGGKTGTSLSNNTWGYGWGDTSVANASLMYSTMPSAGTTANLSGNAISNNAINFTKKLVFAAKFGEEASSGHYRASVMLSLVAEPKEILVLSQAQNLQEITTEICKNTPINDAQYTLRDTRDGKTYTVAKLKDGNCWMTKNLALSLNNITLTPENSNVQSNWTPNISPSDPWNDSASQILKYHNGAGTSGYKSEFGYYYTWCAATADSCKTATTSNSVASSSICPKGWHLPTNASNGSYANLFKAYGAINGLMAGDQDVLTPPLSFARAGRVYNNAVNNLNGFGIYWTATARDGSRAYALRLDNNISPSYYDAIYWHYGMSMRCVVLGS